MTSPEWEAANEDDSDRFPQTSHASAPESTESHERGSRAVPDPARVARYAEATSVMVGHRLATTAYDAARFRISELETPMGWRLGDVIARLVLDSGTVAVADEERDDRLLAELKQVRKQWHQEVENFERETLRAEAAEAKVAKVEALAEKWDGYGHGLYNIHPERNLPCSVCDLLAKVRAVLAEGTHASPTSQTTGGGCPDAPAEQRAKGGA